MTRKFSSPQLFKLLAACIFPIHFWTILMVFQDFSMIGSRTNYWDAIGVMGYALSFALLESLIFFIFMLMLGLIMPKKVERDVVVLQLNLLILFLSVNVVIIKLINFYFPEQFDTIITEIMFFSLRFNNLGIYFGVLFFSSKFCIFFKTK